jgi:hypothetical protein
LRALDAECVETIHKLVGTRERGAVAAVDFVGFDTEIATHRWELANAAGCPVTRRSTKT